MKHILLSLGSAALAAALLCSCGPFQVAEKVVDQADLVQIAEGLATHAENSANVSEARRAGLVQKTYTAESEVDKIKIDEKDASLRIETGNVDRVQVSYMEPKYSQNYRISEGDSTLRIQSNRTEIDADLTYTTVITLPEKEYASIEIEADDSTVAVLDVAADSVRMWRSSNAMVQFSGLTSDQIKATVNNGMVTVSDTTAARLDVSLDNGIIALEDTQVDQYECQVENGSIEGTLIGQAGEYNIRTSVDVGRNPLPSSARKWGDKKLQFHVGNGEINVKFAG